MDNTTSSNFTNSSQPDEDTEIYEIYASIFVAILMGTAMIAMIVNVIVFTSVYWIRRPLPPILKMSISLAAADALSSTLFAISLFINTYLPSIGISLNWLQFVMEMIKLSGILITVTHLLALSLNHYIGILKPLHYNSIVTRRKVTAVTILMWILPSIYVAALCTTLAGDADWHEILQANDNTATFVDTFRFRLSYSAFFFIAIVLMAVCYTHILVIVRRQQNMWKSFSRGGSSKWTNRTAKGSKGSTGGTNCSSSKTQKEQKQLEGNIRAIYTTLLILGSCVIGWMPALLIFTLICRQDCYLNGLDLESLNRNYLIEVMTMRMLENMLVVLKMLANPIIYSIRMKEIQEGTKHMQTACMRIFCPSRPDSRNYVLAQRRSVRNAFNNSSMRTRLTASINNGAQTSHVSIGRSEMGNTLL